MRKTAVFIALVLLLVLGATPVLAAVVIPKLPHAFFGSVLVNGASASNGTQISATVNIGTIISTQNPVTTVGGNYGIGSPYLLVQGYDIPDGATITFRVTNANGTATAGTASFVAGGGPTRRDLSVNIAVPTPAIAAGGGGGVATPTVFAVGATFFGNPASFSIGSDGRVQNTVTMTSPDAKLTMTIPAGTIARDRNGVRLTSLTATVNASPPPPPSGASIIGLVYDFGPNGATFNPPATFTYTYSQNDIPQGVAEESLVLAFYDEQASKWVELPGRIDQVNNTITASIPHFTSFAIIGKPKPAAPPATVVAPPPPAAPAAFSLSNISIQPAQVKPGETVTINVSALNSGGTGGSYTVILNVNGVKEAEKSVTVAAGGSQAVTFSVTKKEPGTYTITVDGLSASFVVSAPELQPPPQLNWTLLGGLMVAAIVVALAFILALARRRRSR